MICPIAAKGRLDTSLFAEDSAIFEYVQVKLVIHHGSKYQVMTNSLTFDE